MPVWEPPSPRTKTSPVYIPRPGWKPLLLAATLLGAFGVFYFTRPGNAPVRPKPSPAAVAHALQYELLTDINPSNWSTLGWSPDKHTVVDVISTSSSSGVQLASHAEFWDMLSSRKLHGVDDLPDAGLLWPPDGGPIAAGSHEATINLVEPSTGSIVRTLTIPAPVEMPAMSFRNSRFAVRRMGNFLVGWSSGGHHLVSMASLVADDSLSTDTNADTTKVESVSYATVQVWDTASGNLLRNFVVADDPMSTSIVQVRLSPDGRLLAVVSYETNQDMGVPSIAVHLWDVEKGSSIVSPPSMQTSGSVPGFVPSSQDVGYIEWSQSGDLLAVANGSSIGLLEPGKAQYSRMLVGAPFSTIVPLSTASTTAHPTILPATDTAMPRTTPSATTTAIYPILPVPPLPPTSVGSSQPTGPLGLPMIPMPISTAGLMPGSGAIIGSGPVGFMQPSSPFSNVPLIGQLVPQGPLIPAPTPTLNLTQPGTVQIISWSPKGDLLASYDGRAVWVWDVAKGTVRSIIDLGPSNQPGNYVSFRPSRQSGPVAWSLDGTLLATLSSDGWSGPPAVHLWDPATGAEVRELGRGAMQIEWSPYADVLAITYPGRTELWGVRSSLEEK